MILIVGFGYCVNGYGSIRALKHKTEENGITMRFSFIFAHGHENLGNLTI